MWEGPILGFNLAVLQLIQSNFVRLIVQQFNEKYNITFMKCVKYNCYKNH